MNTSLGTSATALQRLHEQHSWAIAMAFQKQLQGYVELLVDRVGPVESIVQHYAWVHIHELLPFSINANAAEFSRHQTMSTVHAVMVSWAALAAYPGFSGLENPTFWKKVISTLPAKKSQQITRRLYPRRRRPSRRNCAKMITKAHGFFDRPGWKFPRFLVDATSTTSGVFAGTSMLTMDINGLDPAVSATLSVFLTSLRP